MGLSLQDRRGAGSADRARRGPDGQESGAHPVELRNAVTTPAGPAAALAVLERAASGVTSSRRSRLPPSGGGVICGKRGLIRPGGRADRGQVGTRLLTHDTGQLNLAYMEKAGSRTGRSEEPGKQIVLVTSGSIGPGWAGWACGAARKPSPKQAAAAVGQGMLIQLYEKFFQVRPGGGPDAADEPTLWAAAVT